MTSRSILLLMLVSVWTAWVWPARGEAAGPWRAQVVDAETGQPLEGTVVLAVWFRRVPSLGGWAGGGYHASEEVVTGPDGRFVIQSKWAYTIPLVTRVSGPEFFIFKSGYGAWWHFIDAEASKKFDRGEEILIKLPPLKTRKERLDFLSKASPSGEIPDSPMRKYLEALDQEAVSLGLQPTGRGKTRRDQ